MMPAAGRVIFTMGTYLYPEFSGKDKNVLNYLSCRMRVRLRPGAQQEPKMDPGSIH